LLRAQSVAAHRAEANCFRRSSQYFFQAGTAGATTPRALLSLAGLLQLIDHAVDAPDLRFEELSNCFFIFDLRPKTANDMPPMLHQPHKNSIFW
jgi:hypothetical protein